jgi:hypothetical protein
MPQPKPKKRAAASKALRAVPPVVVEAAAAAAPEAEEASAPVRPARGMTTEQIRRVGNRIAEHERDLKSNTSRRN